MGSSSEESDVEHIKEVSLVDFSMMSIRDEDTFYSATQDSRENKENEIESEDISQSNKAKKRAGQFSRIKWVNDSLDEKEIQSPLSKCTKVASPSLDESLEVVYATKNVIEVSSDESVGDIGKDPDPPRASSLPDVSNEELTPPPTRFSNIGNGLLFESDSASASLEKSLLSLQIEDGTDEELEDSIIPGTSESTTSRAVSKVTTSMPINTAITYQPDKQEHYLKVLQRQLETIPSPDNDLSETPEWMSVDLLPHQKYGLSWMKWREEKGNGGILADEMGLGKTTAAIALITSYLISLQDDAFLEKAKEMRKVLLTEACDDSGRSLKGTFSTLIVVPSSVLNQWKLEFANKVNDEYELNVFCYTDSKAKREKLDDKILRRADVVLTTYDIVKNDVHIKRKYPDGVHLILNERANLSKIYWRRIILDEAHTIRNANTQVNNAICHLEAQCRWALTGTPVHNKLEDFYSLVRFLRILPFADATFWKDRMSGPSSSCRNRLNTLVGTIMLHRDKSILKLPERIDTLHRVVLEGDELGAYNLMLLSSQQKVNQFLDEQQGFATRSNKNVMDGPNVFQGVINRNGKLMMHVILAVLLRLRQAAIHFCLTVEALDMNAFDGVLEPIESDELNQIDNSLQDLGGTNKRYNIFDPNTRSKKLQSILELVGRIVDAGDDVVIVSQFTSVLKLIAEYLKEDGISYLTFDGSLRPEQKATVMDKFVNRKAVSVLLLSLGAGGVGLNIQSCANLIIVDPHWNPQLEEQACSRVHRHGQKRTVNIHKFICDGTIEERVLQLQEMKLQIAGGILSGKAQRVNKLTMDDLRFLFAMDNPIKPTRKAKLNNYDLPS